MENDKRMTFLIELPRSSVKEIHGRRLVAVTDDEVAFAFHTDPMDIIDDVDNVLRTVCNEYVDKSKGETAQTAYLATTITLLGMALDEIVETDDAAMIKRASEIVRDFVAQSDIKNML